MVDLETGNIPQPGEYLPGNWDEGSCTGKTGFKLEWVKFGKMRSSRWNKKKIITKYFPFRWRKYS